jgi:hypothetical protein
LLQQVRQLHHYMLARQLIESLGGRIAVEESHPLWGTTILIELAVRGDDEARSKAIMP